MSKYRKLGVGCYDGGVNVENEWLNQETYSASGLKLVKRSSHIDGDAFL